MDLEEAKFCRFTMAWHSPQLSVYCQRESNTLSPSNPMYSLYGLTTSGAIKLIALASTKLGKERVLKYTKLVYRFGCSTAEIV